MGIAYYVSIAYGFAGEGLGPEKVLGVAEADEMNKWLTDVCGFEHLEFDAGGDNWSGPRRWAIIAKGTRQEVFGDHRMELVTDVPDSTEISAGALHELWRVRDALGERGSIGWKVFGDTL